MDRRKALSVGAEFFGDLIKDNCYYVDKTAAIEELLTRKARVTLFTRPRRFGKTLFMTTLKSFFEIGTDAKLFDGLAIAKNQEFCEKHLGKYPVIFLTLKGVEAHSFAAARSILERLIGGFAGQQDYLRDSDRLNEEDKEQLAALIKQGLGNEPMADGLLLESLKLLSTLLTKHWGQRTVVLIDEYDVPLDAAYRGNYYDEMVELMRGLFGNVLKTNENLAFAVLTGCLRIAKESIFTGLNNFDVWTMAHREFSTAFGFTHEEVHEMLSYYDRKELYEPGRDWYDGYLFGESSVFCPWDVIKYVSRNYGEYRSEPENYWANTSGNALLLVLIERMNLHSPRELEALIGGGSVEKHISQELTYRELDDTEQRLWSVLYMTGYLTTDKLPQNEIYSLVIPNREIRNLIVEHVLKLFKRSVKNDEEKLRRFVGAIEQGKSELIEEIFTGYLREHVSIRDNTVRPEMKENFYHGYLLGILQVADGVYVKSNREAGDGYADLIIEFRDVGAIIEIKYAENDRLDYWAAEALKQIDERHYDEAFDPDEFKTVHKYGMACYKRKCRVLMG